jgi:hypothetical protein
MTLEEIREYAQNVIDNRDVSSSRHIYHLGAYHSHIKPEVVLQLIGEIKKHNEGFETVDSPS